MPISPGASPGGERERPEENAHDYFASSFTQPDATTTWFIDAVILIRSTTFRPVLSMRRISVAVAGAGGPGSEGDGTVAPLVGSAILGSFRSRPQAVSKTTQTRRLRQSVIR